MTHRSSPVPLPARYRTIALIGRGQFGQVYCGVDRQTGELVAMKELNQRWFPTHLFLRELRLLVGLQHPNIVGFHALSYSRAKRYLVMDYCEGGTLRDLIESGVQLRTCQQLSLIADILKGLEYAHQANVIHCDLKPENILLTLNPEGWSARISDFGIARMKQENHRSVMGLGATGSPAYMAPERFYGEFSVASDLYAVGVMLYELLTGDRPFSGLPGDLMAAHLNTSVPLVDAIPFIVRSTVIKALQKLPLNRFASAQAMLEAIELAMTVLEQEQLDFPPLSWKIPHPVLDPVLLNPDSNLEPNLDFHSDCNVDSVQSETTDLQGLAEGDNESKPLSAQAAKTEDWTVCLLTPAQPADADRSLMAASPVSQIAIARSHFAPRKVEIAEPVTQVLRLDPRHWLAVAPASTPVSVSASELTQLIVFTRRGQPRGNLTIPLRFRAVIPNFDPFPSSLFALTEGQSPLGLLIQLRPYRLRLFPLHFVPEWSRSTAWGLVFINPLGQVLAIDWQGQHLGTLQIALNPDQQVTAFRMETDWIATIAINDLTQTIQIQFDLRPSLEPTLQALQES